MKIKVIVGFIVILLLAITSTLLACAPAQPTTNPTIGDVKMPITNPDPSNIEILEFLGDPFYNIQSITIFRDNERHVTCWTSLYIQSVSTFCIPDSQLDLEK